MAPICLLQVNGQKVTAPYEPVDQLRVSLRSDRLFVITDFELVVSFNGKNNAGARLWEPVGQRECSWAGGGKTAS